MNFASLVLFLLIGIGITNVVVNATILSFLREEIAARSIVIEELLDCMLCSGFWIGGLLSFTDILDIGFFAGGFIISLVSYTYGEVMEYINFSSMALEAEIEYKAEDD